MNHLMIDIETMGIRPGAAIVSIGAVQFDLSTGETGNEFFDIIDLQSSFDMGLKAEAATLFWWFKQSDYAKEKIQGGSHISKVLLAFSEFFMKSESGYGGMQVWGNSARFDLGILETAYKANKTPIPWNSWLERDVRTLNFLQPNVRSEIKFEGVPHDPVADCKHQIKYVCEIYKRLNL